MKQCKRPGGALTTKRWPHDRGLNVCSLSNATDAMFVPSSSNPASSATYQRSPARPSTREWKPIGYPTSATLPAQGSASVSPDRTERTTAYRERASATRGGSDGRVGTGDVEYGVQCTDSELPSPLDLIPRSLRTSETLRKRNAHECHPAAESSSLLKLRKTGNSLRLLRLETKRNELGIFFPEAAERLRQNGDAWQKASIVWHSFDTASSSRGDDLFGGEATSSAAEPPTGTYTAEFGPQAAPDSSIPPERFHDASLRPQGGWQHFDPTGQEDPLPLCQRSAAGPPKQPVYRQSGQLAGPSDLTTLVCAPLSTAHDSQDELEEGEVEEGHASETLVSPSPQHPPQAPSHGRQSKKKKKKKKGKQKKKAQNAPAQPSGDGVQLTQKQKKKQTRKANRDERQAACRRACDRIDTFEPTAEDQERLQSLVAAPPLWVQDLEWTQALLKRFAKICGGKA